MQMVWVRDALLKAPAVLMGFLSSTRHFSPFIEKRHLMQPQCETPNFTIPPVLAIGSDHVRLMTRSRSKLQPEQSYEIEQISFALYEDKQKPREKRLGNY
jgi:hypothetical protein